MMVNPSDADIANLLPKTVAKAAEFYASRFGWRVFPLYELVSAGVCACSKGADCGKNSGKHPRVSIPSGEGAVHPATTDPKQIQRWWKKWSTANIGVWLEGSNLIVLDIDKNDKKDGFKGLADIMAAAGEEFLPKTLICDTPSGGKHLYFNFVEGVPNKSNSLGPGLDTWHSKHYVVVPPSNHLMGTYKWATQDTPIDYPEWLKPVERAEFKRPVGRPAKERIDPLDAEDIERLAYALKHVDATDREKWVMVGFALARLFEWSDAGFKIYDEWAAGAHNYDPKKTREQYYKQSKVVPANPITTGSIFEWAKEHPDYKPQKKSTERDQYELAVWIIDTLTSGSGARPVYTLGGFWTVDEHVIWIPHTLDKLATLIAAKAHSLSRYAKRGSDFKSIAQIAAGLCEDERFFDSAPAGIAAPGGLWRLTERHEIVCVPLKPAHRQRFRVKVDPDPQVSPELFLGMLREAFVGHEPDDQIKLVRQTFGLALVRKSWEHRLATQFLGPSASGKSTALQVLRGALPADQIVAIPPSKWSNE